MDCRCEGANNRVYLPPLENGVEVKEYLCRYIEREFPEAEDGKNAAYSVPSKFKKSGEKQASLAEEVVFTRLHRLGESTCLDGTWMTFFHSASYAGHSFRNQRVGKLMIREHDFVIFAKHRGKYYIALAEVKSTYDGAKVIPNLEVISDAKVIKNNKRSAQHQLRDHLEVLQGVLERNPSENLIQSYVMWPFLGALTRDPRQAVIKRWKEDSNLHVFEDSLSDQDKFNQWFADNVLAKNGISEEHFNTLLNRYIILSCGVFVDEIYQGMLALLTQEQLELLTSDKCQNPSKGPMVVHGAAGTGKTLLVLRKLQQLHQSGKLDENNRALYICYWPGIKCEVEQKLQLLGISDFVDTARFYISQTGFLQRNGGKYKHLFMDESEALCLAFDDGIMSKTLATIYKRYHEGNCKASNCDVLCFPDNVDSCKTVQNQRQENWGVLWFLVDINQASLFLPKHSPKVLKTPNIILSKVMRSTGYIFNVFKQFYANPMPQLPKSMLVNMNIPTITMGHDISGPPIYWVNTNDNNTSRDAAVNLVIDLCASKGVKPNDLCILPFLVTESFIPDNINKEISLHFVENGYRPHGVGDVEHFLSKRQVNDFLIAWVLRVKGLEFKVVIMVIEEDDFDAQDSEDRKKTYIMASRCTCMLILVSPQSVRDAVGLSDVAIKYPFTLRF